MKPKSIEQQIKTRAHGFYRGMVVRHKERLWKSGPRQGRVRVPGIQVPFSEADLLGWMKQAAVGGDIIKCPYCFIYLNWSHTESSVDHATPLSRGGGMGLDNLTPICKPCNAYKGSLTAEEYRHLRLHVSLLDPAAQKDIYQRLKSGGFRWHKPKAIKEGNQ